MSFWCDRLAPEQFTLLGGEPTIHPDLVQIIRITRRYWPSTHLRLTTNGFFLHRHPELPELLSESRKAHIHLSIHHDSPDYMKRLKPIFSLLEEWRREYGVKVHFAKSHASWTRRYRGNGIGMLPYNDEAPRKSWEICPAKYCPQLHDGKIWKCAPLAYLPMQAEAYNLSGPWNRYLAYQPLMPDCSDSEIDEFFDREDEAVCGMCPAWPRRFKLPVPLRIGGGTR